MKTFVSGAVMVTLVLALAVPAEAQKAKKKKGEAQPPAITQINKSLEKVELTEEQEAKIKDILAAHRAPLAELQEARTTLLGPEAVKNMAAARKAAAADGKKGKELQAAAHEAAGLSEEQAKELTELEKKTATAATKLKQDVLAVLTAEQKETAGIKAGGRKGNAKGKKKAATN